MDIDNKILLFSPLTQIGGIAAWTRNILEYIKENDIKSIIHVDASLYVKNDAKKNKLIRIYRGLTQTPRLFLKLNKALKINKPNIVWRSCSGSWGFYREILYTWLCKKYNAKSVIHFHFGRIPELSNKKNWEYKIMCKVIKGSYKCIIIDSPSYETLCKVGFSKKICLIPNPCASDVKEIAEQKVKSKKKDSYLFVGHIVRTKGVYELVKAFTIINEKLELSLLGPYEENERIKLERIASRKPGNWLHILGPQKKEIILTELQKATALILPSYTEGFPNVVLEAMACGCPILATSVAAIPDMINWNKDNACGICFEIQSVKEIVLALQKFRLNQKAHYMYAFNGKNKVLKSYTLENIYPLYKLALNN